MPVSILVEQSDVLTAQVDLLVLKFAEAHLGADLTVADKLGTALSVAPGKHKFFPTRQKIGAGEVLSIGVGHLRDFEYSQIQDFSRTAVEILLRERPGVSIIGITVHGPGYGLDPGASFASLIAGLYQGGEKTSRSIQVKIIERDYKRAQKIRTLLDETAPNQSFGSVAEGAAVKSGTKRLFAAMPFSNDYLDHWELAFQPAAHEHNLLIERLDDEHFTGDIVEEIRNRIEKASAMVALLDGHNPNVFLEVGYSWALKKPTLLVLHEHQDAPFDVRSQKIIRYARLGQLKGLLATSLGSLIASSRI